ncbi:hypothetical protein KHA80_22580 [Anaerobacillus sp. HL2]|nr:hypothetical protein KHA80_22580 [Anaerobacillus sp. HL2]
MIRDIKEHPTTDARISTLKTSEREFRGREMLIDPLTREVPLADLDPYIRGLFNG